ncbi:MAG: hypothetical protein COA79_05580 [Planctomycetota bacterium]|nr:MAG: hypothetical protein COA79_05580 [Planctomycetota bacterium]
MSESVFDMENAHKILGPSINNITWELMEKENRSEEEDDLMIDAAHASCFHWHYAGTHVHHQRGEWMIARVYTILGFKMESMRHAKRCLSITKEFPNEMENFDWAFAYECFARAYALSGNKEEALKYKKEALNAGSNCKDPEDREVFESEFKKYDWFGIE